jgi:hypothetical protein
MSRMRRLTSTGTVRTARSWPTIPASSAETRRVIDTHVPDGNKLVEWRRRLSQDVGVFLGEYFAAYPIEVPPERNAFAYKRLIELEVGRHPNFYEHGQDLLNAYCEIMHWRPEPKGSDSS